MTQTEQRRLMRIHQKNITDEVSCFLDGLGEQEQVKIIDFNRYGAQIECLSSSQMKAIETAYADGVELKMTLVFGSLILRSPRLFEIIWMHPDVKRIGVKFRDQAIVT